MKLTFEGLWPSEFSFPGFSICLKENQFIKVCQTSQTGINLYRNFWRDFSSFLWFSKMKCKYVSLHRISLFAKNLTSSEVFYCVNKIWSFVWYFVKYFWSEAWNRLLNDFNISMTYVKEGDAFNIWKRDQG